MIESANSTPARILTALQFRVLTKALEQRSGVNLVTAPKVTTLSARQVQIKIPEDAGPLIDVVPYVSADGYTIQMTVVAQTRVFQGYDLPRVWTNEGPIEPPESLLPYTAPPTPRFRQGSLLKTATVWDGQTIVVTMESSEPGPAHDSGSILGDLPLAGRLFRSESFNGKPKRRFIFITPTLVDPAGNRLHSEEIMPAR